MFAVFAEPQARTGCMPTHYKFEDAPDAEIIAGGIHTRHPDAPAIARHGAFVSWGFEGTPARMTETGRRLFLNVLAYAYAHRGQQPRVLVQTKAREFSRLLPADRPFAAAAGDENPRVDEEAKTLGVANDSPLFLTTLAERLEHDATDPLARALVGRYLPDAPVDGFRAWLGEHEGDLFFSDWGGYRWYSRREVAPQGWREVLRAR